MQIHIGENLSAKNSSRPCSHGENVQNSRSKKTGEASKLLNLAAGPLNKQDTKGGWEGDKVNPQAAMEEIPKLPSSVDGELV